MHMKEKFNNLLNYYIIDIYYKLHDLNYNLKEELLKKEILN